MSDRTPLTLAFIAVLAVIAVFINLDFFVPDYEYPSRVRSMLTWQGEEFDQRDLTLRQGLDLQGGLQVLLEARPSPGQSVTPEKLNEASLIIQNRVDALGVTEPLVQTQGEDKIVVELPGVADPDVAVRTIGQTALLEFIYAGENFLGQGTEVNTTHPAYFRELADQYKNPFLGEVGGDPHEWLAEGETLGYEDEEIDVPVPDAADDGTMEDDGASEDAASDDADQDGGTAQVEAPPTSDIDSDETTDEDAEAGDEATAETETEEEGADGTEDEGDEEAEGTSDIDESLDTIYPTIIDGERVENASVGLSQMTNEIVVNFQLDGDGGRRMAEFTRDHVGEIMAIALDKEIVSSPRLNDSIAGQGMITGDFTREEAEALAVQINSGSLPFSLAIVGQTTIGATLGDASVSASINGGIIGLVVVLLFMLFYYRWPGFLADIALILYALFTLAIFRLLPVTLTLAGIAGFVLSIGMAVDANILIFERMKEELRAGRRVKRAIETGFDRAWPSIRDSNISTLITCAILFWFGNQFGASIVKGFAVTLSLGVLTSLFTAIVVTRNLLGLTNRFVLREQARGGDRATERIAWLFGI